MALGDRRSERITAGSALGCARGRQPRLGLKGSPPGAPSSALGEGKPGWVWRCDAAISRYKEKTCLFGRFFTCSQNIKMTYAIFVNTEGFRPCLSQPSYMAPKWALMVRLMQKERLKSPQKSLIIENQAFWVILAILAKTAVLVILASHFRARVDTPTKKSQLGSCLNKLDGATRGGDHLRSTTAPR